MIELRLIRYALALGRHRNFARAAMALNITQPTLSRSIAALAGYSDDKQRLCFALALWNGVDPILKERSSASPTPRAITART